MIRRFFPFPVVPVAPIAIGMVAAVLVLRLDREIADAWVAEDGPVESFGAACLGVGAVLALLAFLRSRGEVGGVRVHPFKRLAYLGLAVLLFGAFGEELSWGQRILGWGTPAVVLEHNAQGETNVHNLFGDPHGQNLTSMAYQGFWMLFGVALPVAAAASRRLRTVIGRYLPIVPLWLALLFAGQQLLWYPVRANFLADPSQWHGTHRAPIGGSDFRVETRAQAEARGVSTPAGMAEVMETNVEFLLLTGAVVLYRRAAPSRAVGDIPVEREADVSDRRADTTAVLRRPEVGE